ncbi:hypothetical protein [Metabacillus fastidiosus]|uniref:hypothetical protein n=1 Tax=Metabacillus fastidiosus TaxID=1458 RepID=UPI002DB6BCA5|nr:hypothetical protein [Metabacillus fastidiosus]MEC2075123.1 hypothetical protein [Metabacillus fastidiosus]
MQKKLKSLNLVLISLLLLTGCETNNMFTFGITKGKYVHHFPEKQSPALTEFMNTYLKVNRKLLIRNNNGFVYSKDKIGMEYKELSYSYVSKSYLEKLYEPLLGGKSSDPQWYKMFRAKRTEVERKELLAADIKNYTLPSVRLKENNQLEIITKAGEKIIDLPKELERYGVKESHELVINVSEVNNQLFILDILDLNIEHPGEGTLYIGLFVKQDLSDLTASKLMNKDLQKTIDRGGLNPYKEAFKKVGDSKRYAYLFGDTIIDLKNDQIMEIKESDYLSNDGKYIYINGKKDELPNGEQKIQTIDNYMAGNEVYEIEYKLDYKKIAKELDFATSGIGSAKLSYFNEDYVMLRLRYNGRLVGTAGETNVIVDFQEDKRNPTFYLVDLGISSPPTIK